MLPGAEDHRQWSHPLYCPNPVFFLLKLVPGWDHSYLEWFQSRNGQCAFWCSPFPWAGENQSWFFWSCAEGPKALQYRTKVEEHQQSGYAWVFSPHQPEGCVRTTQICVVWTPRGKTGIKLWSTSFCVRSEAEPTADLLRKPIVSQQHPANVRQHSH